MALLSKAEILAKCERPYKDVFVKELGGDVRVQALSAGQYDKYQQGMFKMEGEKLVQNFADMTTRLLVFSIVDEKGNPMFNHDEVRGLPSAVVRKLYVEAQKLNGEDQTEQEVIEKN